MVSTGSVRAATFGSEPAVCRLPDVASVRSLVHRETKKPLAVFIGHGIAGQSSLITQGGLGTAETKTLSEEFVSLYVDVDTVAGKKLAASFEITLLRASRSTRNLRPAASMAEVPFSASRASTRLSV